MVLRSDCVVHTCGCVFVSLTIADNSLSISFYKSGLVSAAVKWAALSQKAILTGRDKFKSVFQNCEL